MENTEIIKKFEKLSLSEKIDFLEDYDIANDFKNRHYFINFIKNVVDNKDYWFLSLVVDLASDLQINDDDLFKKYFDYLFDSVHYLLKLSVLDFQLETYHLHYPRKKSLFIKLEELLNKKNERLIIKNQILLNLMLYRKENRLRYQMILIENLKRTSDYRSHLRVYNTFMTYDSFDFITYDYVTKIISVSEKWSFGKSVSDKIIEIKNYFNF